MRFTTRSASLLLLGLALGAGVVGQQGRAPGQPGGRPGEGRTPEFPPPSIVDYRPRSTLVVAEHPVPRAKFPAVDIHGHPPSFTGPGAIAEVIKAMDALNLGVIVSTGGASGDRMRQQLQAIRESGHADRLVMFTNINFSNVGPGFGEQAARQLEADVKAGALGLGEIMKSLGLTARKTDGSRLQIDDPELDPIWAAAGRLNIPVFIHTADPAEFFQPLDYRNERWLEMALFGERRYYDRSRFPPFEALMGERDRVIARHPATKFILAHLGWHAQDLGHLGAMMDRWPNVYAEVGAVLYDLGRQPRTAHDFFVKYQDRLLFGKDSFQPDEYPYFWRVFETNDEYFDYYRDYHAFWKLYGMGLPDAVLRKLYYGNALSIVPGLPRRMFPM
jgi:predicted TIM-barrel fold metal-dependent hydrolase